MSNKYIDDKMEYIESDINKIQMKTGMYISYVGEKGALHLAKEVIQNSIDECANPNSPAKEIDISLDVLSDSISVEDDGRGIPENDFPMDILCTRLNSGSKFTREQGGPTSGENGVGLTAVNALSNTFVWESYRNGECHKVKFENGTKVEDIKSKSSKKHGCIVTFSPSQKYLGKSAKIPKKGLIEWVDMISYFIPRKSQIRLSVYKGMENQFDKKYKSRPLSDLLESKISDNISTPLFSFESNTKLEEDFRGERIIKRNLKLQFVFGYSDSIEPWVDSYCNYVNTTSGGVHLNSVREAIWRFFMKKTNEAMSDREKEKYHITKLDIETGMNVLVNIFTDMQMQFVGQTKTEISNDDLYDPIKQMALEQLDKYFSDNKDRLSQIVKLIKINCKARIDASKIKAATIKETVNKFDKHKLKKYTPCNNDGKAYKELHLCEGDSASGCLVDGRDPDTQAFLAFRGVTANGFKRNEATILDNKEWYEYVKLLRTQIGSKFDLSKLYFDKIIIETDSDIDGHGITSEIGAFHVLYMPELVKAGKLYKAVAPLYHIDDKKHPYVRDKHEYVEIYQDKIIKNYDVILVSSDSKKPLPKSVFKDFIYDTQEYSENLVRVANHFGINKFLLERLVSYFTIMYDNPNMDELFDDRKFVLGLNEIIQKKFPEVSVKSKQSIRGIVNGRFQSLKVNNRFLKRAEDLLPVYQKYGYSLLVKEKKSNQYTEMSIGQFLDTTNKLRPKILTRYKGLGEMNSQQLWDTTLNPDTRILIQLTMEDLEKDLKIFEILHGTSKQNLEDRKTMMSSYKIKREDLDN